MDREIFDEIEKIVSKIEAMEKAPAPKKTETYGQFLLRTGRRTEEELRKLGMID